MPAQPAEIESKKRRAEYFKEWYEKNRQKAVEYKKQWQKDNSKHLKEYYHKNKVKQLEGNKKWMAENKERRAKYMKQYRIENKDRISGCGKLYRQNNHESRALYDNKYKKEKKQADPLYKSKCAIRSLISVSIKKMGFKKNSRTEVILGCSFDEFKIYLESKFTKGMTWNNHGEWHIDHIIPLASGKTEKRMLQLNHHTNLQPLWATTKIAESYGEIGYIGNLEKGSLSVNTQGYAPVGLGCPHVTTI